MNQCGSPCGSFLKLVYCEIPGITFAPDADSRSAVDILDASAANGDGRKLLASGEALHEARFSDRPLQSKRFETAAWARRYTRVVKSREHEPGDEPEPCD
jgi:hypothetical protein